MQTNPLLESGKSHYLACAFRHDLSAMVDFFRLKQAGCEQIFRDLGGERCEI
ncbi:MAG: hypothetical protein AAFO06_22200 [Cyanobacteria bacterium J06597_16]